MRSLPLFLMMSAMNKNFQLTKSYLDAIPYSKNMIESIHIHDNHLFIGKSDGNLAIINRDNERIGSHKFPSSIKGIKGFSNGILVQSSPTISSFYPKSIIYYHSDKKTQFQINWNDTTLYESVYYHYHLRLNYFGELTISNFLNKTVHKIRLPDISQLQNAYIYSDYLFYITDDYELSICKFFRNHTITTEYKCRLTLDKSFVHFFLVNKKAGLFTLAVHNHMKGIYFYYFIHEESSLKPVHQCFYPFQKNVCAMTMNSPFLFILSDRILYTIRISHHSDREYKSPELISCHLLDDHTDLTTQIIHDKDRILMNGHCHLQILTMKYSIPENNMDSS